MVFCRSALPAVKLLVPSSIGPNPASTSSSLETGFQATSQAVGTSSRLFPGRQQSSRNLYSNGRPGTMLPLLTAPTSVRRAAVMLSVPLAAKARGCEAATTTVPLLSGNAIVLFCVGPMTRLQNTEGKLVDMRQPGGLAGCACNAGLEWSEQICMLRASQSSHVRPPHMLVLCPVLAAPPSRKGIKF